MSIDPLAVLHMGLFLAVVSGLFGWLVAVLWAPFLAAGRFRRLLDSLPPFGWRGNYALWIPLPAVVWGFLCGTVVSVSLDVRPETKASPIYVSGLDGIVVATAVSLVVWPILLLVVLPDRGVRWYRDEDTASTGALVLSSTVWYLLFLVGPAYVLTVLAGFGDAMSHG
jgi:hypothetical protein